MKNTNTYYQAYDKRYKQVHQKKLLWSTTKPTTDVINFLNKYNHKKEDYILDLGCGEGRDAIYLLNNNYKIHALDYSITAINKCNELTNNKYKDSFFQFDIMKNILNKKYKYIYSIAVLHMFVTKNHRNKFYKFIREHLTDDGLALITVLGDGVTEHKSDITKSFINTKRKVMNNNETISIATTSCRVVNWETIEKEINNNKLKIKEKYISNTIPEFSSSMCIIISK